MSQNLIGTTLQQPLSLSFFDLLRIQNAPSESKLFSPISLWKQRCFSVDFLFLSFLFFSFFFFYKWMYIMLVVLHFNLICWLLSIVHELRAELKVDTQNVVRGLYSDRWAKPWMYHVTLWLMSDMLGGGYEARPCDIYQPIFWWCDICRSIVGQCVFLSLFLVLWLGLETWEVKARLPLWKGWSINEMLLLGSGALWILKTKVAHHSLHRKENGTPHWFVVKHVLLLVWKLIVTWMLQSLFLK